MLEEAPTWDAIVIGAGPAGTAAAISATRLALRVLLVDAKHFPRRKVCGGCLNRVSIALAQQLLGEKHPLWSQAVAIDGFRLQHRGRRFEFSLPGGLAVDRQQLDQCLVEQAVCEGVTFVDSTAARLGAATSRGRQVLLTDQHGARTESAKSVVLASGLGSRAASGYPSLVAHARTGSRVGVEALFESFPSEYIPRVIHMAVGSAGYVGLTQLFDGRLHVAAAVDRSSLQRLGPSECIGAILRQARSPRLSDTPTYAWRGTPPLTCRAGRIADRRVFLVGDAAGYIEPFTGEGIRWGLQTGIGIAPFLHAASSAWEDSLCSDWQRWYSTHITPQQRICRQISFGLKHATTRWLAHRLLRIQPRAAQWVITHLNSIPH